MIRLYFDWSVYSSLKKDEFADVRNFLSENKRSILIPYTSAHFRDLMKSYVPGNELFFQDLSLLDSISGPHLLKWENDKANVDSITPNKYFERERNIKPQFPNFNFREILEDLSNVDGQNSIEVLKSAWQSIPLGTLMPKESMDFIQKSFPKIDSSSSMLDFLDSFFPLLENLVQEKDTYKKLRTSVGENGLKLESNFSNWNEKEVIEKIDNFLASYNGGVTFTDYIHQIVESQNENYTKYEFYKTAYLMLDMFGYKPDSLPKPTDNFMNIYNDAEHSFYSAFCDYFVVLDKKLTSKTKVLFHNLNISTKVITPHELIESVSKNIHNYSNISDLFQNLNSLLRIENLVDKYDKSDGSEIDIFAYKLDFSYFNFFTHLVVSNYSEDKVILFEFKRIFGNYSNFNFITEIYNLIERICSCFGTTNIEDFELKKHEFVKGKLDASFEWLSYEGLIRLDRDPETHRPILLYAFKLPNS